MFETMSRSWNFAKMSFGILNDHKQLVVFPMVSTIVFFVACASFFGPLWLLGALEGWAENMQEGTAAGEVSMWIFFLVFYFISYFVMTFFNTGLIACALKVVDGETPTISYGFSVAMHRIPQIVAWSALAAVVGTILKMLERHRKISALVAGLLGTAWSALTFFVVPVLAVEGVGPIEAIKRSGSILRHHWGTALVSNFSLGIIGMLIMIPVGVLGFLFIMMATAAESGILMALACAFLIVGIFLVSTVVTTADVILKAVLYNYATGRTMYLGSETFELENAFKPKDY